MGVGNTPPSGNGRKVFGNKNLSAKTIPLSGSWLTIYNWQKGFKMRALAYWLEGSAEICAGTDAEATATVRNQVEKPETASCP